MGLVKFNEIPFTIPKEERHRGCKKSLPQFGMGS